MPLTYPIINTYNICKTDRGLHLGQSITLIELSATQGIAVLHIPEVRSGTSKPVLEVCSELIEYAPEKDIWHLTNPHIRYDGSEQYWYFQKTSVRGTQGSFDNGLNFSNYLNYTLSETQLNLEDVEIFIQGDGTGTGGNDN